MRPQLLIAALLAATLAAPAARSAEISLPPETALFKPSPLPGYELVQRNCMLCHSVHYIQSQPPQLTRSYWEATVKKMKKPFGAPFPEADIPAMVDYLVKTYGAERSTAPPAAAAK
ncbi:MAG: cytochrome c [Pseudomonadota bacterium]